MKHIKVGILGCAGRMGTLLLKEIILSNKCGLAGGILKPGSDKHGWDLGRLAGLDDVGVYAHAQADELFYNADVLIDFSTSQVLTYHLEMAQKYNKPLVIGITGLSQSNIDLMNHIGATTPILYSPNMSRGIFIIRKIVEQLAKILDEETYDIEISETHHRHKKDAPSGTSLSLFKACTEARQKQEITPTCYYNRARNPGDIGIAVSRGGNRVGDHKVSFIADHETIEIAHYAHDRSIFAKGALECAMWLAGKEPGFYSIDDVYTV